jgi:hypothetical protein
MTNRHNISSADSAEHIKQNQEPASLDVTRAPIAGSKSRKFIDPKSGAFSWLFLCLFEISLTVIFWQMPLLSPDRHILAGFCSFRSA